jgi:hypothetical protein
MTKPNGYVIHETQQIVCIATGFETPSQNIKTGDMIQIWILLKSMSPVDGVKSGADELICSGCSLRRNPVTGDRPCYVNVGQAPLGIWKAWKRGAYPTLTSYEVFAGRAVRFGAYGNPTMIPLPIVKLIAAQASNWTGYTHEWRGALFQGYAPFLMASADSAILAAEAQALGWRTFRVTHNAAELMGSEMVCVNETKGVQCDRCSLCAGGGKRAKSIVITVHGPSAAKFKE